MSTRRPCPQCNATPPDGALDGQCPLCLVRLALEPPGAWPGAAHSPLTPAELQSHFNDMEVLEVLGVGGMAAVYKVRTVDLGRVAAMKVLSREQAEAPEAAERFLREAQALAQLNHPHIVTVYQFGRSRGLVYLLMEYVRGGSVRDRLRKGRLPAAETLKLIGQICDALQYAHNQGVIHRDIKPENLLLDEHGGVKVADFGLAKFRDPDAFSLTDSNTRMGTARYMAPEQWKNTAGVDHRADLYSLGVLFYELLTGDLPALQFTPPSAKVGSDPRLDQVVSKSLKEEPDERYQKAEEVKSAVDRITKTSGRSRAVVGAVLALLAVVALVAAFWPRKDPPAVPGAKAADPAGDEKLTPTEVLTSPRFEWSEPENLGPAVNSPADEGSAFLTADGLTLLFHSTRPGGQGKEDIWESHRPSVDAPFGEPTNLGNIVNGPAVDGSPTLSADGLTLFFHSTRGGPYQIWTAHRPAVDQPWTPPERIIAESPYNIHEFRPWLAADGLSLTFVRRAPEGEGIWIVRRPSADLPFGPAIKYGEFSHHQSLGGPSFSSDGKTVLLNRLQKTFPGNLLWLGRVPDDERPFRLLKPFGPAVNGPHIDMEPVASADGYTVLFQSDRPGGQGGSDLWMTKRVKVAKP